jgi:hypothetical protein
MVFYENWEGLKKIVLKYLPSSWLEDDERYKKNIGEYERAVEQINDRNEKIGKLESNLKQNENLVLRASSLKIQLGKKRKNAAKLEVQLRNLGRKHKKLKEDMDYILDERKAELDAKYKEEIVEAAGLLEGITEAWKEEVLYWKEQHEKVKSQLDTTKTGVGHTLSREVKELRDALSRRDTQQEMDVRYFLKRCEEKGWFKETCGIYLDNEKRPIYATPKFYEDFGGNEEQLLARGIVRIFAHLDEKSRVKVLKYVEEEPEGPESISLVRDGKRTKLEFNSSYYMNGSETVLGTFIQFSPDMNVIKKVFGAGKSRKARYMLADMILEEWSGLTQSEEN